MIDLHLHTTESDGVLDPEALVARAASAGLTTISITDHDTTGGLVRASGAAAAHALRLVPGIEISAVEGSRDVHVLGYFIEPSSPDLRGFLESQRRDRLRRVRDIGARLRALGAGIDEQSLIEAAGATGRSIGRPALADALIAAGHARSRDDAFGRLLGRGCPAYVPRHGASCRAVIEIIHAAGGVAALAHPGVLDADGLIPDLAGAGLDALEVWHSDHSPGDVAHYAALADRHGLARCGGSDFHGDGLHRATTLGAVRLPPAEFERLERRAADRR